jgi:chromosome segregation ATPase
MGRIGVNYQDVTQAIHTLQGQQKTPTVDNVRGVLGTGSKSTIARLLREWKAQSGIAAADEATLPPALLALTKGLWDKMRETTENQASEYRKTCDAVVLKHQQQLQETQKARAALETKQHQYEETLHQTNTAKAQLQNDLQSKETELAKTNERLAALHSTHQNSQQEITRLHDLLKHVQANLEHYQLATQKHQQEQSLLLEKQQNTYEKRVADLQQNINHLTAEKAQYQAENKQINHALNNLKNMHETLKQAYQKTQQQNEQLKTSNNNQEKALATLQNKDQQSTRELAKKNQTLATLQTKLDMSHENHQALKNELSATQDKIESLRQDCAFLSQEKANLAGQIKQLTAH